MHPLITTMTDVINLTDSLLLSARDDQWETFAQLLEARHALLAQITQPGGVEAAAQSGFGELVAQLIAQIQQQNERLRDVAEAKQGTLAQEMRQFNKGDKLTSVYKR